MYCSAEFQLRYVLKKTHGNLVLFVQPLLRQNALRNLKNSLVVLGTSFPRQVSSLWLEYLWLYARRQQKDRQWRLGRQSNVPFCVIRPSVLYPPPPPTPNKYSPYPSCPRTLVKLYSPRLHL
jgi:hypothetical protein